MTNDEALNSPEKWVTDLLDAGWKEERPTAWRSPSGHLFRGPYGAWCKMHSDASLSIPRLSHWPQEETTQ